MCALSCATTTCAYHWLGPAHTEAPSSVEGGRDKHSSLQMTTKEMADDLQETFAEIAAPSASAIQAALASGAFMPDRKRAALAAILVARAALNANTVLTALERSLDGLPLAQRAQYDTAYPLSQRAIACTEAAAVLVFLSGGLCVVVVQLGAQHRKRRAFTAQREAKGAEDFDNLEMSGDVTEQAGIFVKYLQIAAAGEREGVGV